MSDVNLADYDLVLINSSAGKDSQAMLTYLVELADRQHVSRDRLVVVHCDLRRMEWPGTRELAETQARTYGLRFEVVSRGEDLLTQVLTRRKTLDALAHTLEMEAERLWAHGWTSLGDIAWNDAQGRRGTPAWMSSQARYCTSDHKTSQVVKFITGEVRAWRAAGRTRPMRVLNCLGIRAAESPARAKKTAFGPDAASNTKREITRWLPIFDWTDTQVWETIHRSGLPYHPAYQAGMPRLSCVFCVMAGKRELVLAARLNPELAGEYLAVENTVGHTFKADLSMAEIVAAAAQPGPLTAPLTPTTQK